MNLAKKGTVVLAALGVLAMTSCGSKKSDNTMTYKEACAWIKEHYTATKEKGKITKHKTTWDYSKNVKDESMPKEEDLPEELKAFAEKDVNYLAAYSAVIGWGLDLTMDEMTNASKGEVTKNGDGEFKSKLEPLNIDVFKEEFDTDDKRFEYDFAVKNGCFYATRTFLNSREVAPSTGVYAYWWQTETEIFDKEGYPTSMKWTMDNKDTVINFDIPLLSLDLTVNFGELHLVLEDSIAEITPIN